MSHLPRLVIRSSLWAVFGVVFLLAPQGVQGFSSSYDPANWTTTLNGGCGSIDTSGAPGSVSLTSDDCDGDDLATDFTIAVVGNGDWLFDWEFINFDERLCCENAGFLLNGVYSILADSIDDSGNVGPIPVVIGDIIGFRVVATDGCCGSSVLTISNFEAPESDTIPEPSSLGLVALGLAGLALARRQHRRRTGV